MAACTASCKTTLSSNESSFPFGLIFISLVDGLKTPWYFNAPSNSIGTLPTAFFNNPATPLFSSELVSINCKTSFRLFFLLEIVGLNPCGWGSFNVVATGFLVIGASTPSSILYLLFLSVISISLKF